MHLHVLLFYYRFNYQPFFLERRNEKTIVQNLQKEHKEGFNYISYRDAPDMVSQAADYMNITGKRVLVIGTESPWLETVLLQKKPK